ncbi:hypothetical protein VTJ04DRAFT_10897 [Mycothermus thermophilus]|uniref:uncharacterized protein n=1 Tax=Humicola insolens TaxID=85995 RepID=UPI0037440A09
MPRLLRYNLAPSLNGLIASLPGYTHSWIVDDATIDFAALFAEFDTFVMGRRTYETFLSMPAEENLLAGRPRESVVVVSRSVPNPSSEGHGGGDGKTGEEGGRRRWWEDVTVVSEDVVGYVRKLKEDESKKKDIWLMGGGGLARELLKAGLVDTVEAAIMPVIVERGVGIFGEEEAWRGLGSGEEHGREGAEESRYWRLTLESVERKETGILMTRYKVLYS